MNVSELDELVAAAGMPVRSETLAEAWESTDAGVRPAIPSGQVLALITMRARPGMEGRLEQAAREFVAATSMTAGALRSSLHQSAADARTWFLLERFADEPSFSRHMASDYFRRFQNEQSELLAEPVRATFLAGSG